MLHLYHFELKGEIGIFLFSPTKSALSTYTDNLEIATPTNNSSRKRSETQKSLTEAEAKEQIGSTSFIESGG